MAADKAKRDKDELESKLGRPLGSPAPTHADHPDFGKTTIYGRYEGPSKGSSAETMAGKEAQNQKFLGIEQSLSSVDVDEVKGAKKADLEAQRGADLQRKRDERAASEAEAIRQQREKSAKQTEQLRKDMAEVRKKRADQKAQREEDIANTIYHGSGSFDDAKGQGVNLTREGGQGLRGAIELGLTDKQQKQHEQSRPWDPMPNRDVSRIGDVPRS